MDPAAEDDTPPVPAVIIRSSRKGKAYRRRVDDSGFTGEASADSAQLRASSATPLNSHAPHRDEGDGGNDEEDGLSVAEILRLRQSRKTNKLRGVEFRAGDSRREQQADNDAEPNEERALARPEDLASADAVVAGITKRFAPQTGLIGEMVNRHMEEYIEAELARRHSTEAAARRAQQEAEDAERRDTTRHTTTGQAAFPVAKGAAGTPAAHRGRLQEIDLGEEARRRNEAMTERARRRLQGESLDDDDEQQQGAGIDQKKTARLGPDGTPWRGRRRRASEDLKRDELVEAVLRENRIDVDVYDAPAAQAGSATPAADEDEDMAADERIAEEFRRDFLEAMSQRNRRRRAAVNSTGKTKSTRNPDEILRGPKLGGSRNSRAAMRDLLLKEQVAKKR